MSTNLPLGQLPGIVGIKINSFTFPAIAEPEELQSEPSEQEEQSNDPDEQEHTDK